MKRIDLLAIDLVFVVGGNGGNAGAAVIQEECDKAGVVCSIIGVPKSIDNDILLVRCRIESPLSFLPQMPCFRPRRVWGAGSGRAEFGRGEFCRLLNLLVLGLGLGLVLPICGFEYK